MKFNPFADLLITQIPGNILNFLQAAMRAPKGNHVDIPFSRIT